MPTAIVDVSPNQPWNFPKLNEGDPLGRAWLEPKVRAARLPFDCQWIATLALAEQTEGAPLGYVYLEVAKVFAVQRTNSPGREEYQFGMILDFPVVPAAVSAKQRQQLVQRLMREALARGQLMGPGTSAYCFLPATSEEERLTLLELGFHVDDSECIDTELLALHGFGGQHGVVCVYSFMPSPERASPLPGREDFLRQLTSNTQDLEIFSNSQTKVRLRPTLAFWQPIQLYTTYSAYPLISTFLEQLQTNFLSKVPNRLLVAPCAGGDFPRFWPHMADKPIAAVGLDIRPDLLRLAELRANTPEIDILNLVLCEALSRIIDGDSFDATRREELSELATQLVPDPVASRAEQFRDLRSLELLARTFDEILQNRAIPDWYFPTKVLASTDPDMHDSIRAHGLCDWLQIKRRSIRTAVHGLNALALDREGRDLRERFAATRLGSQCSFRQGDLTRANQLPHGPFDLILCWEFIHVFHDQATLGAFLDSMLGQLAPGGTFVLTCIREERETVPPEQHWAARHFEERGISTEARFVPLAFEGTTPYMRRLIANYPILIARN